MPRELRTGRVLLTGDARARHESCGGLGLTTGIWSGMMLADVLSEVIAGRSE